MLATLATQKLQILLYSLTASQRMLWFQYTQTTLKLFVSEKVNPQEGMEWLLLPSARMRSEGAVVGSVCVLHLTSRMFFRLTNDMTYFTGNEGQTFRTVFSENASLQSQHCTANA